MKNFRLTADVVFAAEDLEDAFARLSAHFLAMNDPDAGYEPIEFLAGSIELQRNEG